MSLAEFVRSGITTELDNGQTRMIAGVDDHPSKLIGGAVTSKTLDFGLASHSHLEIAKNNLINDFAAVGIVERMQESSSLFAKTLSFPESSFVGKSNVTKDRQAVSEVAPDIIESINEINLYDNQLYSFANELLTKQRHYS